MEEKQFLNRNIGDRILLGLLCLVAGLVFGSLVYYFLTIEKEGIYFFVLFEVSFSLCILCFLGLIWAIATPKYLERVIRKKSAQILHLGAIILLGTMIFFINHIMDYKIISTEFISNILSFVGL